MLVQSERVQSVMAGEDWLKKEGGWNSHISVDQEAAS